MGTTSVISVQRKSSDGKLAPSDTLQPEHHLTGKTPQNAEPINRKQPVNGVMGSKKYGLSAKGYIPSEDVAVPKLGNSSLPKTKIDTDVLENIMFFKQTVDIFKSKIPRPKIQTSTRKQNVKQLNQELILEGKTIPLIREIKNGGIGLDNGASRKTQIKDPKPKQPTAKSKIPLRKQTLAGKPKRGHIGLDNEVLKKTLSDDKNTLPVSIENISDELMSYKTLADVSYTWLYKEDEDLKDVPPTSTPTFSSYKTIDSESSVVSDLQVRPVEESIAMTDVVSDEKAKIIGDAPPPPDHLG